jgi:hypothetical protein
VLYANLLLLPLRPPPSPHHHPGLMIQCSPSCWLKTSVESGAPGQPSQLGVVVTNGGFSDWSTQDFPSSIRTVSHGGGGGPDGNPWHAGIGSLVLRVGARASMGGGGHIAPVPCVLLSAAAAAAPAYTCQGQGQCCWEVLQTCTSVRCVVSSSAVPCYMMLHCAASQVALRVRREGSDYIVEACVPRSAMTADATQPCSVKVGSGAPDRCA